MNPSGPLVSVLVPIYGVEKYIERCARSIFEQTYQNLEIIFVNDCSPDNSIAILNMVLDDYPERKAQTRIIDHEKNKGLAAARKTALLASSGYYIQNFDSDDYVEIDMISKIVALAESGKADITICDLYYEYEHNKKYCHVNPSLEPLKCLTQILKGQVHSGVCNKLIKRSLYTENAITPIDGINMLEDMSVMYRLMFYAKKISYLPIPLYHYVQYNSSSYTTVLSEKSKQNILDLIQLMEHFFENNTNDEILYAFDCFRLINKVMLIVTAKTSTERRKYLHLFPEINIKNYKNDIIFSNYIILKMSSYGLFWANLILKIKVIARRIKSIWNKNYCLIFHN